VLQAISNRRAYRALSEEPIEKSVLLRLIEAAQTAPSGANNQPWRFITITDPAQLEAVKSTLSRGNYWAKKAPAIIAVVTNNEWGLKLDERLYAPFDVGMATMALQIQAVSEGLYVHPIAGFKAQDAKAVLEIPQEDSLLVLLILGYPGSDEHLTDVHLQSEHGTRVRLPLESIHSFDNWSGTLTPKAV